MTDQQVPPTTAAAGWYADPEIPEALRYWSGDSWTDHRRYEAVQQPAGLRPKGWTADGYIGMGLLVAFFAGFIAAAAWDTDPSMGLAALWFLGSISSLILGIGVVAKGVEVGLRYRNPRN